MSYFLILLIVFPIRVYYWARKNKPEKVFLYTGAIFGIIVLPFCMGLYFILFIPTFGFYLFYPSMAGYVLLTIHGYPGSYIIDKLNAAQWNHSLIMISSLAINSLLWMFFYGTVGRFIDKIILIRKKRHLEPI